MSFPFHRLIGIAAFLTGASAFGAIAAWGDIASRPALYAAEQATRGAQLYAASCAQCHGVKLEGASGPGLVFADTIKHPPTLSGVWEVTRNEMPMNAPGSLSREAYAAIVAYILEQNGFPSGAVPLSEERAAGAQITVTLTVTTP